MVYGWGCRNGAARSLRPSRGLRQLGWAAPLGALYVAHWTPCEGVCMSIYVGRKARLACASTGAGDDMSS